MSFTSFTMNDIISLALIIAAYTGAWLVQFYIDRANKIRPHHWIFDNIPFRLPISIFTYSIAPFIALYFGWGSGMGVFSFCGLLGILYTNRYVFGPHLRAMKEQWGMWQQQGFVGGD